MLGEYSKETSPDYAYRDVADIRSWYYRYYYPGSSRTLARRDAAAHAQPGQNRVDAVTRLIETLERRAQESYEYYFKEGSRVSPPRGSEERQRQAQQYFEGLSDYIRVWVPRATDFESVLLEDIEQVYILYALQSFKRSFAVRTANALRLCAVAAAVLLVMGLLFSMASPPPNTNSPHSIVEKTPESSVGPKLPAQPHAASVRTS
jgi:hypothetical protein